MKTQWIYEPQSVGTGGKTAWSASGTSTLTIGSKPFVLYGIQLNFLLNKTGNMDTRASVYQDYFYRAVKGLTLIGNGKYFLNYVTPDLRPVYWAQRFNYRGRLRVPDYTLLGTAIPHSHSLVILFNPHQMRSAGDLNLNPDGKTGIVTSDDLTLQINWGAAAAWGSTGTIASGYCQVSYLTAVPGQGEPKPSWYPEYTCAQLGAPTQTFTGLGWLNYVPVGWWYRRSTVMLVNGAQFTADNRTDALPTNTGTTGTTAISEIGLQLANGLQPVKMKTRDFAQLSQANWVTAPADDNTDVAQTNSQGATAAYGLSLSGSIYNPGVGQFDYAELGDKLEVSQGNLSPDYGVKLVGKDPSSLAIASTVDGSSNTFIYVHHERYKPY